MSSDALPYENATSGDKAIAEMQKILRAYGCRKFATGNDYDTGNLFVQFEHQGRVVQLEASAHGYAQAYLKRNPFNSRRRTTKTAHEAKALEKGEMAVYSILRDWLKGQITAIEIGILEFESAFLPHIVTQDGRRVIEVIKSSNLLPPVKGQDV